MDPNNGDKTVIIPTPGRKSPSAGDTSNFVPPSPQAGPASVANPQQGGGIHTNASAALNVKRSLNNLVGAATELIALVGELRHTIRHADPSKLRNSIIDQVLSLIHISEPTRPY